MTEAWLGGIAAVLSLVGWALVARGAWGLAQSWLGPIGPQPESAKGALWLALTAGAAAVVVAAGLVPSRGQGLTVPLAWPVLPLGSWALVVAGLGLLSALWRATVAGGPLAATAPWAVATLIAGAWAVADPGEAKLLTGAAVLPWGVLAAVLLLGTGCAALLARADRGSRGRAKGVLRQAALIGASAFFALPVAWMLLTSFREPGDDVGGRLLWLPMVTEQHQYEDPSRPLVGLSVRGRAAQATVLRQEGDTLHLELERPYPLRGERLSVPAVATQPLLRSADVVTARIDGREERAFVIGRLVGGRAEVETFATGERTTLEPGAFTPVRRPGLRGETYGEALEWLPESTDSGLVTLSNSLWLAGLSVVGTVLSCSFAAYGFARMRFPGRAALFALLLATLMLPSAVTLVPKFLLWRSLGAVDTLVPVWLPTFFGSAFFVFLLRQAFLTVPRELEDAAKIDGCTPVRTYWSVVLPQVRPVLAVVAVWTFIGAWNDFLGPLVYVSSPERLPVAYALQLFHADRGSDAALAMAAATLSTVPVFLVFLVGLRALSDGLVWAGLAGKS